MLLGIKSKQLIMGKIHFEQYFHSNDVDNVMLRISPTLGFHFINGGPAGMPLISSYRSNFKVGFHSSSEEVMCHDPLHQGQTFLPKDIYSTSSTATPDRLIEHVRGERKSARRTVWRHIDESSTEAIKQQECSQELYNNAAVWSLVSKVNPVDVPLNIANRIFTTGPKNQI